MSESSGGPDRPHLAFLRPQDRSRLGDLRRRKDPVQSRSRDTVDVILEGAAQVFEEHGFEGATTDQIAERAGVSIGSLYQYFPNKQAIACAWMERHGQHGVDCLIPVLLQLRDGSPSLEEGVALLVSALLAPHTERRTLHRVLAEQAPIPPAVRERKRRLPLAMAPVLEAWLRAAGCGPDPVAAAALLAATLTELVHGIADLAPETLPLDRAARELERMLIAYLRTPAAG